MKTDNKTMNKTEYAEMVRSSIAPRILSEAANHTFEKRSSRASTWAAAACFALIFAAAAIFLFKPKTDRGEAGKGTPSPESTKTAQTTPDTTSVPTPDISNMRIIYGSGDAVEIDDIQHQPGTVTLYGGLNEMLADEQYANCVFAVDIKMEYRGSFLDEHLERKSEQLDSLPAVILFNRLYEQFVEENRDRYSEFFNAYYAPDIDEGDDSTDPEVIEALVFKSAFVDYLYSSGQMAIYQDYEKAREEFGEASQTLWADKRDGEVQRLKDLGYRVSLTSDYLGEMQLFGLLTRDQLLNFPASPEFAYIITPAVNGDDTPEPTEAPLTTPCPSKPIGSGCDPYCMENWETIYRFFMTADENGVTNGEKCFENYDPSMTAFWGTERGSEEDSWLTWKAAGTAMPDELYLTDVYLAGTEDAPLQLIYQKLYYAGDMLESFICENVIFDQVSIENDSTIDHASRLKYVSGIHAVNDAVLEGEPVSGRFDISSETHCRCESNGYLDGVFNDRLAFTVDLISAGGGSVGISGGREGDGYTVKVYAAPKAGHGFIGWFDAEGNLISAAETLAISYVDENGGGVHDFTATARFGAGASVDEAQAEHIINLLAEYHAAQFTRSAEIGELKLSDNVLSDLEERQRCIDETEERIGQLNYASATVNRLYIAPYYEINGDFKCFTVLYYELVNTNYCSDLQYDFLIRHTVTVAPDGTVLSDIFSEKNTTGFSNTPLGGETLEYYPITSDHYDYLAAANALLAGEAPERTDFSCGQQYVFFRFTDDGLMAYDVAYGNDDYEFLFGDPIAVFPREVSELAYRRLNEYYDRYVSVSDHSAGPDPIYQGFIGENWFALVTLDDSMHDLQVHCIFYFDGSEWHEIIGNNGGVYINGEGTPFPHTIFGACVLDEDTAIICYYTKWFFTDGSDDGKLYIYRTENGGESWSRLDIVLPDFYNDMSYYAPLTPIFDESGQHGVIILDCDIMVNGESAPFGWLESLDGGQSWNYRNTEITP